MGVGVRPEGDPVPRHFPRLVPRHDVSAKRLERRADAAQVLLDSRASLLLRYQLQCLDPEFAQRSGRWHCRLRRSVGPYLADGRENTIGGAAQSDVVRLGYDIFGPEEAVVVHSIA